MHALIDVLNGKVSSSKGSYEIVDGQLLISGQGFVGADEHICLRLERQ